MQLLASNIAQESPEAIYWRGALVQPSCTRPLKGCRAVVSALACSEGAAGWQGDSLLAGLVAADGSALALVLHGRRHTDDVDGDLVARDSDVADDVLEAEERSQLRGVVARVL